MQEEIARLSEATVDATAAFIAEIRHQELPDLNHSTGNRADWEKPYHEGLGSFWIALAGGNVVGTIGLIDVHEH